MKRRALLFLDAAIGSLLLIALSSATATACILNDQSSLSANGSAAVKNYDSPTGRSLNNWAPFNFQLVYGIGSQIRFNENFADLRKSLSRTVLGHPFLWKWGDGSTSRGFSPTHAFARGGDYVVNVYAYDPRRGGATGWFRFDEAKVKIVPPGEVWKDNLGQTALSVFGSVTSWGIRVVLAAGAALIVYGFADDFRRRRRKRARTA